MHVAIMLAAYRGLEAEARRLIGALQRRLTREARGLDAVFVQLASLVLNNGLGRYDDALRDGYGSLEDPEPVACPAWALPELSRRAHAPARRTWPSTHYAGSPSELPFSAPDWGLGLEARSRALLCEGSQAESCTARRSHASLAPEVA